MRKLFYIVSFCLLAVALPAVADTYYFCDFENDTENATWQLNKPRNTSAEWKHLWYIGSAAAKDGERGLYVSSDNGVTASYQSGLSCSVIAWREFNDLEAGEYDVAIDWRNVGDSLRAALYVAWVPDDDPNDKTTAPKKYFDQMVCGQNNEINARKWISDNFVKFVSTTDTAHLLSGSSVWSHSVGKVTVKENIRKYRLVFVFVTAGNAAVCNPGACVDNVQIARNNCGTPTDLTVSVSGRQATFTWKSRGQQFNIRYSKQGADEVKEIKGLNSPQFIQTLDHGVYNFYIQVVCNGETSVWYAFPVVIIYDSKCFNYLDLTGGNCYYSDKVATVGEGFSHNENLLKPMKIDKGFQSMYSRHTIHYMEDEFDARTYNSIDSKKQKVEPLRTIPEGEIASVRVGSWEQAGHVARIAYDFVVDTTEASVLMLKYALVLQTSGHVLEQRPRFILKVVDADTGKELSKCTTADFSSQTGGEGWNINHIKGAGVDDSNDICWRDWTTIGMNLSEYNNAHIRILLTVYGCTQSYHYAYAYFTLNCASGRIEGINCGDNPTNEFIAPPGFDYRWYLASDPNNTLSTKDTFPVEYDDDRLYMVDVTYKTNKDCGFTLSACAIPRYPVPEATYEVYQKDCKNYIRFTNKSHVRTKNIRTGEVTEYSPYSLDAILWDFGNAAPQTTEWAPEIELPAEGGNYHVALTTTIGLCDTTAYYDIAVPAIAPDTVVENPTGLCEGTPYTFEGKKYSSDTTIVVQTKNIYGCDSLYKLVLRFNPIKRTEISETILEGTSYTFDGKQYTTAGKYEATFVSAAGCDSIVTLNLSIEPSLKAHVTSVAAPCAGDENHDGDAAFDVEFAITAGVADECRVSFSEAEKTMGWKDEVLTFTPEYKVGTHTISISIPKNVVPGWYPFYLHFDSKNVGSCRDTAMVEVRYPASVIETRWSDVFVVSHDDDYREYQWYKNGEPIEGATGATYFEDGMDARTTYSVRITLADGTALSVCPFTMAQLTPVEEVNGISAWHSGYTYTVERGSVLPISMEGISHHEWYSLTGQRLHSSSEEVIRAPQESGWYILKMFTNTGEVVNRVVVL